VLFRSRGLPRRERIFADRLFECARGLCVLLNLLALLFQIGASRFLIGVALFVDEALEVLVGRNEVAALGTHAAFIPDVLERLHIVAFRVVEHLFQALVIGLFGTARTVG